MLQAVARKGAAQLPALACAAPALLKSLHTAPPAAAALESTGPASAGVPGGQLMTVQCLKRSAADLHERLSDLHSRFQATAAQTNQAEEWHSTWAEQVRTVASHQAKLRTAGPAGRTKGVAEALRHVERMAGHLESSLAGH